MGAGKADNQSRARLALGTSALLVFVAAYMIAGAYQAWAMGNHEFQFYIATMVLLIAAVLAVHARVGLSLGVLWGFGFWGAAHLAGGILKIPESWPIGGEKHVLYNLWLVENHLKYDQLVHAYGFGMTTWLCWQGLRKQLAALARPSPAAVRPTLGVGILCIAAGMGFGALNEVIEFIATQVVPNTNVGGYENTGWDLIFNLIGSTLAMVLIAWAGPSSEGAVEGVVE